MASLVALVVVSGYSLLVIRLSLTYLTKEEYGLLSLLSQVSNYIAIIDFGLYTAFSRILIDYTSASPEKHANALKTASRVFQALGLIGFLLACVVALAGASCLSVPSALHYEFQMLMFAQGAVVFSIFASKPLTVPLYAHGRQHLIYWITSVATILNALIFWLALHFGIGIYSSVIATLCGIWTSTSLIWGVSRPFRTVAQFKGNFDKSVFREVLSFGRDSMLWQIGGQTLAALPIILVSSWFTLTAAADLSAGMKMILLMVSVCTRLPDMAVAPLSIQFAKGEDQAAIMQMKRIAGVSGGVGCCAALGIICVNPSFIHWWTSDKVSWPWHANLAGAYWIAIISLSRCVYSYAVVCRKIDVIRWALLLECALYLIISYLMRSFAGPSSLVWSMPIATLITGILAALRIRGQTSFNTFHLLPTAARQATALIALSPPAAYAGHLIAVETHQPLHAFMESCFLAAAVLIIAYFAIFSRDMRAESIKLTRGVMGKLFPAMAN